MNPAEWFESDGLIRSLDSAELDAQFLEFWLAGRPRHTRRAYSADVARFTAHVGVPLSRVTEADVQSFVDAPQQRVEASRIRTLSALRSMFGFGFRIGFLPLDLATRVALPTRQVVSPVADPTDPDVRRMVAVEPSARNRLLIQMLYCDRIRIGELCALRWRDLDLTEDQARATVGAGRTARTVALDSDTAEAARSLRSGASDLAPVFHSRKGGHLDPSQVLRIVHKAAERAGIGVGISARAVRRAGTRHARGLTSVRSA